LRGYELRSRLRLGWLRRLRPLLCLRWLHYLRWLHCLHWLHCLRRLGVLGLLERLGLLELLGLLAGDGCRERRDLLVPGHGRLRPGLGVLLHPAQAIEVG
jgi:hypothetical protein